MSVSIEKEIHKLLLEKLTVEKVGELLVSNIENSDYEWTAENLNSIYVYLLKTGQGQLLIDFVIKHVKDKKFVIPWGHFIEAVSQLYSEIAPELLKICKVAIKETQGKYLACQSEKWDAIFPDIIEWRAEKNLQSYEKAPLLKKDLFEKLNTLRTQQLYIAEQELLQKLNKMFPGDLDVQRELQKIKERYAYEVLNRYAGFRKAEFNFEEDQDKKILEAFAQSLLATAKKQTAMAVDFAVVAWMLEDYENSYQILQLGEKNHSSLWMKTELQLKTRRYVELLEDLVEIEMTFAGDPETFFATALLRAQAFWGLGQKHTAIEILEGLLASRPSYRSASVLLDLWRTI